VLAVIVVLTAGWPLVSATVAGHRPVAAGTTVAVGPSGTESGRVTLGPGWSGLTASSNPRQYYSFSRGALRLSVRYVGLARVGERGPLFRGMRQILRLGYPGVTAGRPEVLITAAGDSGLTASLAGAGRTGQAAVVAAPTQPFAIEMVVLGPPNTARAVQAAGLPVIRSLRFPAEPR
jgi:hypothetical protein